MYAEKSYEKKDLKDRPNTSQRSFGNKKTAKSMNIQIQTFASLRKMTIKNKALIADHNVEVTLVLVVGCKQSFKMLLHTNKVKCNALPDSCQV